MISAPGPLACNYQGGTLHADSLNLASPTDIPEPQPTLHAELPFLRRLPKAP